MKSLSIGKYLSNKLESSNEIEWRAEYLRLYVLTVLVGTGAVLIARALAALLSDSANFLRETLPVFIVFSIVGFVALIVSRHKKQGVINGVLCLFLVLTVALIALTGGVNSPFIVSIPVIALLSAFLIRPSLSILFIFIGLVGYGGIVLAQIKGWLPQNLRFMPTQSKYVSAVIVGATYLLNAFVVWVFAEGFNRRRQLREESENRYRMLVDGLPDPVMLFDVNSRIIHANRAALKKFGYEPCEVIGRPGAMILPNGRDIDNYEWIVGEFKAGKTAVFETEMVTSAGEKFQAEINANPIIEKGEVKHVLGIFRDITTRKNAENALRQSERFLTSVFSSIQDGLCVIGTDMTILRVNPTVEKWYAHALPLVGRKCWEAFGKNLANCEGCSTKEALETGEVRNSTIPRIGAEGILVGWLELYSYPLFDPATGNLVGVIEYSRDITSQRKIEDALKRSEEQYRSLAEAAQDFIFIVDREFKVRYVNAYGARLFGLQAGEIAGKSIGDFFPPQTLERQKQNLTRVFETGEMVSVEGRTDYPGGMLWLETKLMPIKNERGEIEVVLGISRDVTARRKAEDALKESEERYRTVIETSPDAIAYTDPEGKIIMANKQAALLVGLERVEEIVGLNALDMVSQQEKPLILKNALRLFQKRGTIKREFRLFRKDGSCITSEISSRMLADENGYPRGFLGIARDVTERKLAEDKLRESEQRYRGLVETSPDAILLIDLFGQILMANRQTATLYGVDSPENMIGLNAFDLVAGDDRQNAINNARRILRTLKPHTEEYSIMRKDGSSFHGEITGIIVFDAKGKPNGYLAVLRDITHRKEAEERLRESENRFRTLADAAIEGILIHENNTILEANKAAGAMFGCKSSELVGRLVNEIVHPDDREYIRNLIQKGGSHPFEARCVRNDGSFFPLEGFASEIPYKGRAVRVAAARDVSDRKRAEDERKRLQEQLILSDRLASLGQLVQGIAHEFNNVLAGIRGYAQLSMMPGKENRLKELPEAAIEMVDRAQAITENLITFSERFQPTSEIIYPAELIWSIIKLMRKDFELGKIQICMNIPDDFRLKTDGGKLQQVLLNLIVNARHAMQDGGVLTFGVRRNNNKVWLDVSDTGCGIPEESLTRVFEPFFTTKGALAGSSIPGTGLGLSLSYGIMQSLGGTIEVESKVGAGSTFKISMPIDVTGETAE